MLTIEQRLQHLEDEAAIRDLAARFADAATRADYETIRSLFTPDAVFTIGEPFAVTCKGPNEIVAHSRSSWSQQRPARERKSKPHGKPWRRRHSLHLAR